MQVRNRVKSFLLVVFFVGWITYAYSLFDVGRFSITLLILASCALSFSGFRLSKASFAAFASLTFSTMAAFAFGVLQFPANEKTLTHLLQSLLAIGVMTGSASLDWKTELRRLRWVVLVLAILVLGYGMYQIAARKSDLPGAFLPITNQQLGTDEGLQRGFSNEVKGATQFTRVSSFFPEPSDMGRFMLWVFAFGFSSKKRGIRYTLITTGVAGIILSQSMGALVGLSLVIAMNVLLKHNIRRSVLPCICFGIAIVFFSHFLPEETERIKNRGENIAFMRSDQLTNEARFASFGEHLSTFLRAPVFGYGIASFQNVTEPGSVVSSTFMVVLVERGIMGALLFFGPFAWSFAALIRLGSRKDENTETALIILMVEIYCFATFATAYFPPTYLALGMALRCVSYAGNLRWPEQPTEAICISCARIDRRTSVEATPVLNR